jgi:hypothetical protein
VVKFVPNIKDFQDQLLLCTMGAVHLVLLRLVIGTVMTEPAENLPQRTVNPSRKKIMVGKSRIPKPAVARMEAARERQMRALELRKARATYGVIAEALGFVDASAARKAVLRALERQEFEAARDVVLLDLQTLDELQMRCTEALRRGDLFQVDKILRVMQQRYQLLGVSSRTVEELQQEFGIKSAEQAAAVTNNGVMIIQGTSESEFVRSMMQAVGINPEDPAAKAKLLELESGKPTPTPAKTTGRTVKRKIKRAKKPHAGSSENTPLEKPSTEGGHIAPPIYDAPTQTLDEDDIIDAEIVEDDIDDSLMSKLNTQQRNAIHNIMREK